ncbi:MFS general substrate transporter [Conidiobolus coronatus NRRL 28638]|uniref:MFS general substrate transporter n=1 Tax=Conidiobolus coronatus (strain ATCC 28846 / CBS 209.66 / NRRL 28638) TaxID=796925 RepID=A0A137NYJ5_CONC2|nr:MFS general substrate transporter [Conidiobolus coronatus NRRL 28638]|eukprot:KXN67885.1 MFS general substrate transporter [Conidiobolus coronatus NRRL 28638]
MNNQHHQLNNTISVGGGVDNEKKSQCGEAVQISSTDTGTITEFHSKQQSSSSANKTSKLKSILHKVLVTFTLVFGTLIACINETAISTSGDSIARDLGAFGSLTWIAGGYALTALAFTPSYGKLSVIFGRKNVELSIIFCFFIGNLGSSLAHDITTLIIFRSITGIGGGGLMAMSWIMIFDLVPLDKRSDYLGLVSITIALGQNLGPIFGGLLAEINWRYMFYLTLPLCVIFAGLVYFVLDLPQPEGNIKEQVKRVDYFGCLTLILSSVALILATNWGGVEYPWNSAPIIILFILMVLFFIAFCYIQWKVASEPILPARIMNRNVILASIGTFMAGGLQYIAMFYLPIYFQFVDSTSPSMSGYLISPYNALISIICMLSGYFTKLFNTIRGVMWVGGVINLVGLCLIYTMKQDTSLALKMTYILIHAVGIGLVFQLTLFTSTLSVHQIDTDVASCLFIFVLHVGGVVALAIVGSLFNRSLIAEVAKNLSHDSKIGDIEEIILHGTEILTGDNLEILKTCYFNAFKSAFVTTIPFGVLMLLALLGISKIEIPKKPRSIQDSENQVVI